MERPRNKYDRARYEYETGRQKDTVRYFVSLAKKFQEDPDREARLKKGECACCFYRKSRIGGAAITSKPCDLCETMLSSGNTCVDAVCENCSQEHGICRQCGADLNLKIRRKPFRGGV